MNVATLLLIAIVIFVAGYLFYSRWLASKVLGLDPDRKTPAVRLTDGKDYVPTSRWVTFFYHFATISGSGVLIGPTLAAQYGWLPCLLWILAATCLAGGVHDMVVLTASLRHDGKSIAQIALAEVGPITGTAVMVAILFMVTTAMAGFGLGAVAALEHNPWGTFAVAMTIPVALLLSAYLRWFRPGKIIEASLGGVGILALVLVFGSALPGTWFGNIFDMNREGLIWALVLYAFLAAALPVGLLVRPRDYLSAFIKVGTIVLLVIGSLVAMPALEMPAVSQYIGGGGPIIAGSLWPFLFIVITCGAISGWHALCCSGVTPKLLSSEKDIRPVAYGGWLLESCIAVLALGLAAMLAPGDYYAINATPDTFAGTGLVPSLVPTFEQEAGMTVQGKPGGPVSLAFSMTLIFSKLFGGWVNKGLLFQFFILFLGLFIVAVLDHGTRMARYFVQELVGKIKPSWGRHDWTIGTVIASALSALAWGALLYTGEIGTLWPVFGICNQLLATTALAVGTIFILRRTRPWYALTTAVPMLFFAAACLHGGILRVMASFAESAKAAEQVQGGILVMAIGLVLVVLIDCAVRCFLILRNRNTHACGFPQKDESL